MNVTFVTFNNALKLHVILHFFSKICLFLNYFSYFCTVKINYSTFRSKGNYWELTP